MSKPACGSEERVSSEPKTLVLRNLIELMRSEVDSKYRFHSTGSIPWTPMSKSLERARVALITTGGFHLREDAPFRALEERLGDTSFRVIPHRCHPEELDLGAPTVDQKYTPYDLEVALPARALDGLVEGRWIESSSPRHFSFCGGIVRPLPGLAESAARVANMLRDDGVDVVVLIPTCSLCVQTVCVLACELEAMQIPTVALSLLPELSKIVGAPRTLTVRFPFGAPCGDPGNSELHRAVLREALTLLIAAQRPGEIVPSRYGWRRSVG